MWMKKTAGIAGIDGNGGFFACFEIGLDGGKEYL